MSKEHLWKPGQSGNPKGRPTKAVEDSALNMLHEVGEEGDKLRQLCEKLWAKALNGEYRPMELLFGYMIGKPVARVERVGGNAMEQAFERLQAMQQQSEQAEIEQMYGVPENENKV